MSEITDKLIENSFVLCKIISDQMIQIEKQKMSLKHAVKALNYFNHESVYNDMVLNGINYGADVLRCGKETASAALAKINEYSV